MTMFRYAPTIEASRTLMQAFVQLRAGRPRDAYRLFASLKSDEGMEEIMDGLAKGAKRLEAMDDEELNNALDTDDGATDTGDTGDTGDNDDDDGTDLTADDDDGSDDLNLDDDDDDDDDAGDSAKKGSDGDSTVSIPASVAEFLGL